MSFHFQSLIIIEYLGRVKQLRPSYSNKRLRLIDEALVCF
jgi:hypothetical protein